jgi:SAM-dependent methyltransferase
VVRHREALTAAASAGIALDLACGRGRHARLLAQWGLRVVGLDRDAGFLRELRRVRGDPRIDAVRADVEDTRGLPIAPQSARVLLITRFLDRDRCGHWARLLAPGGLLLYETFRDRQRDLARGPKRADFLLEENELPSLFPGLEVLVHEEGLREAPQREWVASLLARKVA